MDLRNGINKAVDAVISHLKSKAWMISTPEEIMQVWHFSGKLPVVTAEFWCLLSWLDIHSLLKQVATISANSEREIGELIAKAMEKVGKEGVITVTVSAFKLCGQFI